MTLCRRRSAQSVATSVSVGLPLSSWAAIDLREALVKKPASKWTSGLLDMMLNDGAEALTWLGAIVVLSVFMRIIVL